MKLTRGLQTEERGGCDKMFVIETLITSLIFMCGFLIVPTLRDTRSALSELKEEVIDNEDVD